MRRRQLIGLLAGAAASRLPAALAQQKPMPVVGFLSGVSAASYAPYVAAFRKGLSDTGHVEGKTVAIEYRWAEGQYDRLPALAGELVGRNADVIATGGSPLSAVAAKSATSTIPIVFVSGEDPVRQGLVANFARPSGNLTGLFFFVDDLMPKRLELLLELVPQVKVIALMVNPKGAGAERIATEVQEAARAKAVSVEIVKASTANEIEAALESLSALQAGALLAGSDAFFNSQRNQFVTLASRHGIPAMYDAREYVEAGGLTSYGVSLTAIYRQLGVYAGKILNGAKPADLPVQQPTKFELVINLKTAKALGLTVPQSLLARADEVLE